MARIRHLSRAPITEALVDFRVSVPDGTSVSTIEAGLERAAFGYEKKGPILRGSFGLRINAESSPIPQALAGTAKTIGVRLHSADETYVAQFTTEGFTLSRLEPYQTWEALIEEARRLWPLYAQCVKPTAITRTATRFINNLRLPLQEGERFEKYLTELPAFPSELPQTVSSFLQRFVIHDTGCGARIVLTQALEGIRTLERVPVILDVDVFRETRFPPENAEVWNYLEQLRSLKNAFFFAALTDEAVELYV